MISEARTILFEYSDVVDALILRLQDTDEAWDGAYIESVAILDDDIAVIRRRGRFDGSSSKITMPVADLQEALARLCIGRQIPLPRQADKNVVVEEGHVGLMIRIHQVQTIVADDEVVEKTAA